MTAARVTRDAEGLHPLGAAPGGPKRKGGPEGPSRKEAYHVRGREWHMLSEVMQKLSGGIKDGAQGGGGQLAGAIAMIVGGGVIVGAAAYFGTIDTSWAG